MEDSPPGVLRLAGHPVRWRLLRELSRSDRQVGELAALVGQRQSLTSYHLAQLRSGGLVRTRRSSADKRDTYYSLDLVEYRAQLASAGLALHPGVRLAPAEPPPSFPRVPVRVLFLCTGNSSRSQMAEALLERLGGGRVRAASAGSDPKPLHPEAVRVMRAAGIDIAGRHPKHLSVFADEPFDHVISLCDRVRELRPAFAGAPTLAHWSLPDPATSTEPSPFARTAEDLTTRITFLLHAIDSSLERSQ
ncbi:ArsR family transcriptional regulator [Dactylosporangium sp. NPDC050588]|uniref:arsenate reductase/protein-tyrosine-phosphatase family protein n=1 Tax=Dactylosporangium sp. NPDC050588 TaxID=3157211 RepID=UPI00340D4C63